MNDTKTTTAVEKAKAQSVKCLNKVDNEDEMLVDVICGICKMQYTNPKFLPCLHSFCQSCLTDVINGGLITCARCSWNEQITGSSEQYLQQLPCNFIAINTLDTIAMNAEQDKTMICCVSCSKKAVNRCSQCAVFLCVHCERRDHRKHKISSIALLSHKTRNISYCLHHTGEILQYYCNTCHHAVCKDCTILDHQRNSHDITMLSDKTQKQRKELTQLATNIHRKIPFLKRTLFDIDAILAHLPEHADAVAKEIARTTEHLMFVVKKRQERLLDELTQLCLLKVETLQEQKTKIEGKIDVFQSNYETTNHILRNSNDSEIANSKSLLEKRLEYLCDIPVDIEANESSEFSFKYDESSSIDFIENNGTVLSSNNSTRLKAIGDGLYDAVVGKPSTFLMATKHSAVCDNLQSQVRIETPDSVLLSYDITQSYGLYNVSYTPKVPGEHEISITVHGEHVTDSPYSVNVKTGHMTLTGNHCCSFGMRGNNLGYFNGVCDVAVRNNGNILTVDSGNHRIQEFDDKGKLVSAFGVRGEECGHLLNPSAIAISSEGHVIVTDHGNHRVQVFTSQGLFLSFFGHHGDSKGFQPTGIAVNEEGQLVIVDEMNHRVQVFDQHGIFKHQYGSYGCENGQFNHPLRVAISSGDGDIFVTDSGNHRVQIFTEFGCFQHAFGKKGTENGQFYYPSGITIDPRGFIYISDQSNRIQIFNSDLNYVTCITSCFNDPVGLDYCPEGRIVVADKHNHRVKIIS